METLVPGTLSPGIVFSDQGWNTSTVYNTHCYADSIGHFSATSLTANCIGISEATVLGLTMDEIGHDTIVKNTGYANVRRCWLDDGKDWDIRPVKKNLPHKSTILDQLSKNSSEILGVLHNIVISAKEDNVIVLVFLTVCLPVC